MAIQSNVRGPKVTEFDKNEATELLTGHPAFPKNAKLVDVWPEKGHWAAAWETDDEPTTKTAEFPPAEDGPAQGRRARRGGRHREVRRAAGVDPRLPGVPGAARVDGEGEGH